MLATIRSRVIASTISIALASAAVTGWLVARSAADAVRESAERSLETDTQIYEALISWGTNHTSWEGVDDVVRDQSTATGRRIVVTDARRRVLADSDRLLGHQSRPLPTTPAATLDPGEPVVASLGDIALPAVRATDEEISRNQAALAQATSCLTAKGLPFVVVTDGTGLGYVDLSQLTTDDQFTTADECTVPLYAPSPEQIEQNDAFNTSVMECLSRAGVDANVDLSDPAFPSVVPSAEPGATDAFDRCITEVTRSTMAPPALLFLGTRANAGDSLSGLGWWRMLAIVAAVLAIATVAAWWVGRLLTRPLARLAQAAHQVGAGDRAARVGHVGGGEIGEVAGAFDSMATALDHNDQLRRRMVSDIAHELRNPLVTINGTLEAIQDGVYEPTPEVIDSLAEETDHLRRLVADLQELSLADAGGLRVHPEPIDAVAACRTVVEAHRAVATASGVALSVEAPPSLDVDADPVRVRQIVANLLSNALRHTPAGGSVTVSVTASEPDWWHVAVADTGEGIDDAHLEDVFERFWRADPARARSTGGTGLGLAITRELAVAHGGSITAESVAGTGSRFVVSLPRHSRPV